MSHLIEMSNITTRANNQFPRPDIHRLDKQPYRLTEVDKSLNWARYIHKELKPIPVRQSDPELDGGRFVRYEGIVRSGINRLLAGDTSVAFGGAEKFITIGQRLHERLDRFPNNLRAFVRENRDNRKGSGGTAGN